MDRKRFKLNEIWTLLKWILVYEISLGVIITLLNLLFHIEALFHSFTYNKYISYELFSLFALFVIELLGLTQLYLLWYKKYGEKPLSKIELLKKLITKSESKKVEFKSSLRWDVEKNEYNKELEKAVIKTISGFLNAEGGSLVIGVSDKKVVEGLEKDFQSLPKKNKDGFENHLVQIIRNHLGSQILRLLAINFYKMEDKSICTLKIKRSEEPVFTNINGNQEFFVRVGNSTASLSISEAVSYVKNHWKPQELSTLNGKH